MIYYTPLEEIFFEVHVLKIPGQINHGKWPFISDNAMRN